MNLGSYYRGEAPPPIKKKSKILLFTKKVFLFCMFRIIDFIFFLRYILFIEYLKTIFKTKKTNG